ncbi:MAG: glycoside hydrolase family 99-like domain-containing protein [Candidatus Obscuribacterales bacterium]|nr:glycoside hydrolase family 99-like domain-containing protein [Candidatus Obscuribacterales bacterium]
MDTNTRAKILETPGLFDAQWYLNSYPDVANKGMDPLEHFFQVGAFEGRNPSPVFDTKWYAEQAGFSYAQENGLLHYMENSATNKLSPCPLFDSQFYLKNYADVREAGINPFSHYMSGGAKERRRPNDVFLPDWYAENNPDAENPLVHHLKTKSVFSPLFNQDWYKKRYANALDDNFSPLAHYLVFGRKANFSPNPYFDALWYQQQHRKQIESEDPFAHFIRTGDSSGLSPGRSFDSNWYRWRHADAASSDIPPFRHFISSGEREGREFSSVGAHRRKVSDIAIPKGCTDQEYFLKEAPEREACDLNEEFPLTKPTVIAFYDLTFSSDECFSKPSLFAGHYQPKKGELPPIPDARERFGADCKLAKRAGIDVFCLEITADTNCDLVQSLREQKNSECRICLRFDTLASIEVELSKTKSCLKSVLNDPAYFAIDSKPVLFIRQTINPGQEETLADLKEKTLRHCGCEPFMIASYDSLEQSSNVCDAFLHDPSNVDSMQRFDHLNERIGLHSDLSSAVGYTSMLVDSLQATRRRKPVIKTVVPSFDNAKTGGFLTIGSKPKRYEFWLNAAISYSRTDTVCGVPLICLNSWNNWQNGSYVEPDAHFGFAYLNATNRAITGNSNVHFDALAESSQRLKLLLVGKTADKCSETLLLLKLARLMKRSFGLEPVVLLLHGGQLQSEFESVTATFVVDEMSKDFIGHAQQLLRDGFRRVLCNSVQTGNIAQILAPLGFDVITLVQPTIRETDSNAQEEVLDLALQFSRLLVFSSHTALTSMQSKTRTRLENHVVSACPADIGEPKADADLRNYAFDLLKLFDPSLIKVSVAVPNYNYSRYLKARLDSIFAQTYPIYELVVLDDGSSDNSLEVLNELQKQGDRDFQILLNETNSGSVFKQWHKSTLICSGEVIWIAEADDGSSPEFLRALAPRFYDNPELNLVFANSSQTDEHGELLSDNYDEYYRSFNGLDFTRNFEIDSKTFLAKALSVKTAIANVSSALIRRYSLLAVIDEMQSTLGQLKVAGDWRIYIELCKRGGKIGFIREPLNVHRRHSGSVTHSSKSELLIRELRTIHDLAYAEIPDPVLREEQMTYVEFVENAHAERESSKIQKQATNSES